MELGRNLRDKLGLFTQEELATLLEVTPDTLREWRRLKQGPDFVKTGKGVMYRLSDIQDWLKINVVLATRVSLVGFVLTIDEVWVRLLNLAKAIEGLV